MNVLIASFALKHRQGAEVYARDLALELRRQGHTPTVYATTLGPLADELGAAGIFVTTRLRSLRARPDIIHGNFRRATLAALRFFPDTPAIAVCHAHMGWPGGAAFHPRIRRYLGMSQLCVNRLREERMPEDQIRLSWNFVDTARFRPRPPLPERPARALVFSNYAHAATHLPAVAEACWRAGLQLDVVGTGVGNPISRPEDVLGQYDLVFAKAKAAIEAMAVGSAVVLCDFGGVGPLVTTAEFERLRPMNFGFQSLRDPLSADCVLRQIARYNAHEAARVRDLVRERLGLEHAVEGMVALYREVIHEANEEKARSRPAGTRDRFSLSGALARDTVKERALLAWLGLTQRQRDLLLGLPGARIVRGRLRKLFQ